MYAKVDRERPKLRGRLTLMATHALAVAADL